MLKANINKGITDIHLTNVIENNIVVGSSANVFNGYAYDGINAPVSDADLNRYNKIFNKVKYY